jgi:hypothetical protein
MRLDSNNTSLSLSRLSLYRKEISSLSTFNCPNENIRSEMWRDSCETAVAETVSSKPMLTEIYHIFHVTNNFLTENSRTCFLIINDIFIHGHTDLLTKHKMYACGQTPNAGQKARSFPCDPEG